MRALRGCPGVRNYYCCAEILPHETASRRVLKCCPAHLPPVFMQYKSGLLGRKYRRDVPKRCAVAAKRLCRMQCVCPFGERKIIVLGVRPRKIACCRIKKCLQQTLALLCQASFRNGNGGRRRLHVIAEILRTKRQYPAHGVRVGAQSGVCLSCLLSLLFCGKCAVNARFLVAPHTMY